MRIHARSESRQALNALSLALAANCDHNPDSDYPFEIMAPFEQIAAAMGMLHVYDNGHKAYDSPLKALSVLELLGYVIVLESVLKTEQPRRLNTDPDTYTALQP